MLVGATYVPLFLCRDERNDLVALVTEIHIIFPDSAIWSGCQQAYV